MESYKSPDPRPAPRSPAPRLPARGTRARTALAAAALSVLAGAAVLVPVTLGASSSAAASSTALSAVQAAPPAGTGPIVKLWSWNWNSVARECVDVLGPAGYGAVQVSPPHDSMSKGGSVWWDVYQPARYTLTSKFGDENAFKNMIDACHGAGVKVHVDAVVNHMTGQGSTSYGGYSFSKYNYPGLYSSWDFRNSPSCVIDDEDYKKNGWRVQNCELVSLADLDTGSGYVRDRIAGWLNRLTALGVDGFRIDAAKHIHPDDLAAIKAKLTGSPYLHLEVIYGEGEAVQPSQYTGIGDVHEFVFGRKMKEQFTGQIKWLRTFGESWGLSVPADRAVTFVDNHDTERKDASKNDATLNYKYGDTYKLANVFMLAWPYGTPRVYSGFTWSDKEAGPPSANGGFVTDTDCGNGRWTCFHRQMAGMAGFHKAVAGTSVADWYDNDDNVIAFSRGNKGWVAINNGSGSVTRTFTTGLPAGTYANVAGSGSVTVGSGGTASVTVPAKSAVAVHVGGGPTPTPTATPSPTVSPGRVAASFNANATTYWGQNVFVVGDAAELGSWNPANAVALSAADYPVWKATVNLPAGRTISYKYIKKNPDGSVTWESDPDRSFTTPATGTVTRTDTWR
ncbi:alpha-amylase [Planobispora longispora]|uniref:Alpha-amylase n=1 Tax=Planobispora longispora TaxID=28887 RepID=A0A8J3RF71_9ACTN|nr:carbohydrate-binding module family 20 domain-containing protein [Planobispora longispora]GIH73724.1 alpha-amylase [Planobispora longispora]